MEGCPYCEQAYRAIKQLKAQNNSYADTEIEIVDKNFQPEIAKNFAQAYYYVPSMFVGNKKIYEAHPGETYEECLASVEKVFQAANQKEGNF